MLLIDGNPQINLTSAVSELLTNAQYTTGAIIWQNFFPRIQIALCIKEITDRQRRAPSSFYKEPAIYTYEENHKKLHWPIAYGFGKRGSIYSFP